MKNFLFLCLLTTWLSAPAQSITLTTRQVMDFEVGDVFHYEFENQIPIANGHKYGIRRKQVIAKNYNIDSSEVSYTFEKIEYRKSNLNDAWTYYFQDTISQTYTGLDSVCYNLYPAIGGFMYSICQDIYSSPTYTQTIDSAYNNRISVLSATQYNYYKLKYAQGLGEVYRKYNSAFQTSCKEFSQMVYFKKGTEVFGTPDSTLLLGNPLTTSIVSPTNDSFELIYQANEKSFEIQLLDLEENIEIFICDMSGRQLLHQVLAPNNEKLLFSVKHLQSGIYAITLRSKNSCISKKVAII